MNAIGIQLRDRINSGLTRWRKAVEINKMDAAAELGGNLVSKYHIQPEYGDEQADAGRDRRTVSRDQIILRRERGLGNTQFPSSADHEQGWQSYPVDPLLLQHVMIMKVY